MVLDDLTAHDKFLVLLEWMLALEKRHADVLQPALENCETPFSASKSA